MNIWKYVQSVAVSKRISAILFVFRPSRDADRVTVNACTGWVKHMGRFSKSRTYEFSLDTQLETGNAEVALLGAKKELLMKLNRQASTGKIDLAAKNRYYLRWQFEGATGKCVLRW